MGPIYCALAGIAVGGALAVVYAFAINWIPFIYINFFLSLGLGFAVGMTIAYAAKAGKVRNATVACLFGLIFGLFTLYVAWAFDPQARIPNNEGFVAWDPNALMGWIQFGYEKGFWSIGKGGGDNVSGMFLAIVWLIEAGIIVGLAVILAPSAINAQPFCEDCNEWATTEEDVARLAIRDDNDTVLDRLLGGEVGALSELPRATADAAAYLRCDLAKCESCPNSNWLTISVVVHGVDNEGKATTDVTPLLAGMEIEPADVEVVRAGGAEPAPVETTSVPDESDEPIPFDDEEGHGDEYDEDDDSEEPTTDDFKFT